MGRGRFIAFHNALDAASMLIPPTWLRASAGEERAVWLLTPHQLKPSLSGCYLRCSSHLQLHPAPPWAQSSVSERAEPPSTLSTGRRGAQTLLHANGSSPITFLPAQEMCAQNLLPHGPSFHQCRGTLLTPQQIPLPFQQGSTPQVRAPYSLASTSPTPQGTPNPREKPPSTQRAPQTHLKAPRTLGSTPL